MTLLETKRQQLEQARQKCQQIELTIDNLQKQLSQGMIEVFRGEGAVMALEEQAAAETAKQTADKEIT